MAVASTISPETGKNFAQVAQATHVVLPDFSQKGGVLLMQPAISLCRPFVGIPTPCQGLRR
jgi:hypothetical protein